MITQKQKAVIQLAILTIIVFAIDNISKKLIFNLLDKTEDETSVVVLIPHLINLEKVTNTGGFWGVFKGKNKIIMCINLLAFPLIFIIFYKFIFLSIFTRVGLSLIIGGALGNIIDRILYGYVRDFISIQFIRWPIFNFADTFITIGAAIMIIHMYTNKN